MANIKKSFNFRNGVQVDDDNFIVNPNGLVGIGSTIPTESLDVQGNIRLRGILYADSIEADSIINTSDNGSTSVNIINVGITSITSGIISASSGIVTYYGDGRFLQGLPTSQWVDVDPSLNGYTSIYAAGNVGIATTNPFYTFQVGAGTNRVGISSGGDVIIGRNLYISGITTVNSNLNVNVNLNVSGITTSYSFSGFGTNITGINASNISNGTLLNDRLPSNINKPSGIATFSVLNGGLVGIATTARGLTADANIDIVSIISDYSNLGITTTSTLNVTNSIGIGTNNPNSDLHLRKTSNTTLEITSNTNAAKIIIGREVNNGFLDSFGILRFGNTDINENLQSTGESFDIINYAPGNLNYYIRPESTSNLKFNWINYSTNSILMSLTSSGKLGIGKTNPNDTIEVVGTSTVTSNSFVGGYFSVSGEIKANTSLTVTGNATINSKLGIKEPSPVFDFQVGSEIELNGSGVGVGINTNGNMIVSGIVTASKFVGIGSNLTLITPENISSGTISNVNITNTNINSPSGIVTASKFVGIGSNLTQITPENMSSGTISNVNINSPSGIVTASKFVGIGSNLTLITPENMSSGTISNVNINNSSTGIIISGIVSITGSNPENGFWGNGTNITNISPNNINSGNFSGSYSFGSNDARVSITTTSSGYDESDNLIINKTFVKSGLGTFDISTGIGGTIILEEYFSSLKNLKYDIFLEKTGNYIQSETVSIISNGTNAFSTSFGFVANPGRILSFSSKIIYVDAETTYITLDYTPESGISGLTTFRYTRHIISS